MKKNLIKLVVSQLREVADKIENGNCEISIDEISDIIGTITHEVLSKTEACEFLNVSKTTFDLHVRLGNIPKGKKRRGFKELIWYKDELKQCLDRLRR